MRLAGEDIWLAVLGLAGEDIWVAVWRLAGEDIWVQFQGWRVMIFVWQF